jgi:hypothetical protein
LKHLKQAAGATNLETMTLSSSKADAMRTAFEEAVDLYTSKKWAPYNKRKDGEGDKAIDLPNPDAEGECDWEDFSDGEGW